MDFSICQDCLGDQTRLTRAQNGAECKICTLPFTVYHFKANSKVNRTLICHNCSKQRNVCQCCMLDLQWHIPIELRDRILSSVQGTQVATPEAQNEMMKRFIALKNGDKYKVGGASVTSDALASAEAVERIRKTVDEAQELGDKRKSTKSRSSSSPSSDRDVDISHLIKKLPLKGSLEPATSFFIYNLDPSIPEWAIVETVSELVGTTTWQDPNSTSIAINHMARCGGLRFKSMDLGEKFRLALQTFQTPTKIVKGKLQVQNSKLHCVAWPQFHRSALGINNFECLKLAQNLDILVQKDLSASEASKAASKPLKVGKSSKGSSSKKAKKPRRIVDIEL
ncbi:LAFA_0D04346g1_1 [Lachancea sp. 'fantastica']|nr:LAFA_0D04346g1_1 [Lachancea sp. 'fantastica']